MQPNEQSKPKKNTARPLGRLGAFLLVTLALLLFHEKVTLPLMIGGLTVIVGLMLYTYGEMKAGKR